MPTTGERAFVQIKAKANTASLSEYSERFVEGAYDRMFFVWHTGQVDTDEAVDGISAVGPERLAIMVLDAGLASWLREKVS